MKLKIKAKAILGAAAVMMGMFVPMCSASAESSLLEALKNDTTHHDVMQLAKRIADENPDLINTPQIWNALRDWSKKKVSQYV